MFLSYFDESGYTGRGRDPNQPVLVVAGVVINAYRAPKTGRDWRTLLNELQEMAGKPLTELKGRELFRGDGPWKQCHHTQRAKARIHILEWLTKRNHKIVASSIVYEHWKSTDSYLCAEALKYDPIVVACVHIGLIIQRINHASKESELNKKKTLLVFDHQTDRVQKQISELLAEPPEWAMAFVRGKCGEENTLPVLIDSAYFADSIQAPLIQVADFLCFMLQRRASLSLGYEERFAGEQEIIDSVTEQLDKLMVNRSHVYPSGKNRSFARLMESVGPPSLTL